MKIAKVVFNRGQVHVMHYVESKQASHYEHYRSDSTVRCLFRKVACQRSDLAHVNLWQWGCDVDLTVACFGLALGRGIGIIAVGAAYGACTQ